MWTLTVFRVVDMEQITMLRIESPDFAMLYEYGQESIDDENAIYYTLRMEG